MEISVNQLLLGLMSGGLVALIPVIMTAIKQWRQGRVAKEDQAINRWKELANEKRMEADLAWKYVASFRRWYYPLWSRYVRVTGDEDTFPSDPPQYDNVGSKKKESNG